MSSFAISSLVPLNVTGSNAVSHTTSAQPQPQAAPAASAPEDTVKLSDSAQAQALYQSGDSVSSISSALGLSTSVVDSYLGITQAVSVPTHVAAQHSAPAASSSSQAAPAQATTAAHATATVAKS